MNAKNQLFELHDDLTDAAYRLMLDKNADYAGKEDPFANFRLCEAARLCSAQQGILMRMLDKVSRLSTHASGQKLNTDSMRDSVIDIINYAVLFYGIEHVSLDSTENKTEDSGDGVDFDTRPQSEGDAVSC